MRILAIVDEVPFPVVNGGSIRIGAVLRGFAELGEVDLLAMNSPDGGFELPLPLDGSVSRAIVVPRPSYRGRSYVRWLRSQRPYELVSVDYSGLRSRLRGWAADAYDLVYLRPVTFQPVLADLLRAPSIVDMDDLKSDFLAASLRTVGSDFGHPRGDGRSLLGGARRGVWAARMRTDVKRWHRLERQEAHAACMVFVASEFHRRRLGTGNRVVIPNPYPAPPSALGVIDPDRTPTISFIGTLTWPPNRDAASRLATVILPLVRERLPNAEVRLVGFADDGIMGLSENPGVSITGRVPSLNEELCRADLVAVPIRFAGGTRIKILEAFAHGIPVVSTTMGCEGLDVVSNEHLVVADTDDEFAAACVGLLCNVARRSEMTRRARELYESRYRSDQVERLVADAASAAIASRGKH